MILRSFCNTSLPQISGARPKTSPSGGTTPNSPNIRIRDRTPTRNTTIWRSTYEDSFESQIELDQTDEPQNSAASVITSKVPNYIREKLIKRIRPSKTNKLHKTKAQIGFVSYIGSPVNGHMVIGNPEIVDIWLDYIRKAVKNKIVTAPESTLTTSELNKLCNVVIIPGNRHEFNISYDIHIGLGCASHKHDKRLWESPSYPSKIISCECLTQQLKE